MWEFILELFKAYGPVSLVIVLEAIAVVYLYIQNQNKEKAIVALHEKRLEDALECKEDYEELAQKLDRSIDLLIKAFRSRNSSNGSEEQ